MGVGWIFLFERSSDVFFCECLDAVADISRVVYGLDVLYQINLVQIVVFATVTEMYRVHAFEWGRSVLFLFDENIYIRVGLRGEEGFDCGEPFGDEVCCCGGSTAGRLLFIFIWSVQTNRCSCVSVCMFIELRAVHSVFSIACVGVHEEGRLCGDTLLKHWCIEMLKRRNTEELKR